MCTVRTLCLAHARCMVHRLLFMFLRGMVFPGYSVYLQFIMYMMYGSRPNIGHETPPQCPEELAIPTRRPYGALG